MRTRATILALILISLPLTGQTFISAKAGLVNYEEGVQATSPRQLQEGEIFSTPNRSELLMMPGAYVRLERSAEVRMISTSVTHPEVELLGGLISVEINEMPKESSLALAWGDYHDAQSISITHRGLYRFETSQDGASLKVMVQTGQLRVGASMLKDGEEVVLSSGRASSVSKFDRKLRDDFDIWAAGRDQLQSVTSYRTASAVGNAYYPAFGTWAFNPLMGFFTYLPYSMITSPWGFYYYSPQMVGYYPFPYYGYGYGYGYPYGYYGGGSPVRSTIGTTPSLGRVPVYGTTGGASANSGSNSFAGSSPRSGAGFSGAPSMNAGGSSGTGASSGFGGASRAASSGGGGVSAAGAAAAHH